MKLTTTVYKYKRAAPWMVAILMLATLYFFVTISAIGIVLLLAMAIVAALRPNSLFSIRSADERKLVFTPEGIEWGTVHMPIGELENLKIYIYAFDSFRHRPHRHRLSQGEYGDKNKINFIYRNVSYEMIFFLGTFEHYDTLISILQHWRQQGIVFSVESAFSDAYIRQQVNAYR